MSIVLAEIQLNEHDGQLIVDKYLYNNSFPEYNEESYYRLWKETIPFDEWAEDAPEYEWEELVNNTALDISKIKKEKVKNSLKEEPHVRYRTDEELNHIMNDFGGEDILDDERTVID